MNKWYTDSATDSSVIISSRIRLARNYRKYPFLIMMKDEDASKMIDETVGSIKNDRTKLAEHIQFIDIKNKTDLEKKSILEKHVVSPEFLRNKKPNGLLLQDDEKISIMINEEDHIRIQAISPGEDIDSAWNLADKIDDLIEETVEYAFDKDYGFLTSCPTNTGTGLRASFMIHLPMLEKTGQLKHILPAISKFGMILRGIYGEGTEPMGSIYQISNQLTMGKTEEEIISSLKNVTKQLIEKENLIRQKALSEMRFDIEDRVYRAYGVLSNCRRISGKEAMGLLSDYRLGYICKLSDIKKTELCIYNIMMNIQPGNLQMSAGRELNEHERDIARASYLRKIFKEDTYAG